MAKRLPLLVVDGYNVIHATLRYAKLIDDGPRDLFGGDPFDRAREALLADVAAAALHRFEPVIVFDGAGNLSPDRPNLTRGGVKMVFSETGESADTVIERLVSEARRQERDVTLVTSDTTIRATVGGLPITAVSSAFLASTFETIDRELDVARQERSHGRMTLEDRLSPEQREKLNRMLNRNS